jgi:hypothetical protein
MGVNYLFFSSLYVKQMSAPAIVERGFISSSNGPPYGGVPSAIAAQSEPNPESFPATTTRPRHSHPIPFRRNSKSILPALEYAFDLYPVNAHVTARQRVPAGRIQRAKPRMRKPRGRFQVGNGGHRFEQKTAGCLVIRDNA